MKKAMFVGLVSALILSGVALATQVEDEKKGSSMQGMMQEMMKGENGKGEMMGMMRMRGEMETMMDQCASMMESMHPRSDETKESQRK